MQGGKIREVRCLWGLKGRRWTNGDTVDTTHSDEKFDPVQKKASALEAGARMFSCFLPHRKHRGRSICTR